MGGNDFLFDIVHSLNTREQGYFKRFSKGHSGEKSQDFIELFDVIKKSEEYSMTSLELEKNLVLKLKAINYRY